MLSHIRCIGVLVLRLAVAVGIVIAAATALSAQPVYRLHDSGDLWVAKAENCRGEPCVVWHLLDNNPKTQEITAGGQPTTPDGEPIGGFDPLKAPPDAPPLYQRRTDGTIWLYTGKPCIGGSCPGWQLIDKSPQTASIVAAGEHLYQRHNTGAIWSYNGTPCRPDGSCPGWQQLDNNPDTAEIIAAGRPSPEAHALYKRHKDGTIWRYTGSPCSDTSCWQRLDNNPKTRELTAAVGLRSDGVAVHALYQRQVDGTIWHYTGPSCSGASCWKLIDNNPGTISIVTNTETLYQLRNDGAILVYTGKPCDAAGSCPGWLLLDNNPRTRHIAAGARSLYKRYDNGAIWRYATGVCSPDGSCPPWQLFYDPTMRTIVSTQN